MCQTGEVIGWSGLVEPYRYTFPGTAWQSTKLIRIETKMPRRAMDMFPEMGYKLMKSLSGVMSRRLRQTADALTNEREMTFGGSRLPPE